MEAEVEQLLASIDDAYQRQDAQALAALYHPNARHPLPTGGEAVGRAAIAQMLPAIFEMTPKDVETETISRHIDLLTQDVAIIDVRVQNYRRMTTGEREALSVEGFTIVAVREQGQWLVGAVRGALVPKE